MLPRIRITDLPAEAEVATWTLFPDCFTHLRTGETAADNQILMAGSLADGLNLGLTRMATAMAPITWHCAAWSTSSSESGLPRISATAWHRHRTASSSRLPVMVVPPPI
jgi:hypothetical protein